MDNSTQYTCGPASRTWRNSKQHSVDTPTENKEGYIPKDCIFLSAYVVKYRKLLPIKIEAMGKVQDEEGGNQPDREGNIEVLTNPRRSRVGTGSVYLLEFAFLI